MENQNQQENYKGFSQKEVRQKQKEFGLNEIESKKPSFFIKLLKWFISPIALMLLTAALLSLFINKLFDFYFILVLMLINFFIGFWQEKKADNAIEKLSQKLSVKVKVLREENWLWLDSKYIVVGDIIDLNIGDIIPADIKILEAKNFSVNEAVLTGESLPQDKKVNDKCFSSSFVALGWARAEVLAIGKNTYFGKILISIDKTVKRSLLEKDILNISKWLSLLSLFSVVVLSIVFYLKNEKFIEILTLDLSLIIAGIPISLPTIMTLIINFGVLNLAKKNTIVRRLSALEDISNVDLLLSDKTGTLTRNEINVEKIINYNSYKEEDLISLAFFTTLENDHNPINLAIRKKAKSLKLNLEHKKLDFIPFDSARKRSAAQILFQDKKFEVIAGAPQVVESLSILDLDLKNQFEKDISDAAKKGYRAVAISTKEVFDEKSDFKEEKLKLVGVLLFSDSLEKDAEETIQFIKNSGIKIKMVSGDNILITKRIADELKIEGEAVTKDILQKKLEDLNIEEFEKMGTFAEILPTDKLSLVNLAQKKYVVAVTGDGINDLPALKSANVSIAVKNAVDALKSSADFVLTNNGISVIKDAIIESRKIFARLYSYSVYRISESFRVIVTIAVLGLIYGKYPLSPIQLILLALLNDIPIISLAFNRVKIINKPSKIDAKKRLKLSTLFGLVGTVNSLLFLFLAKDYLGLDWQTIQTLFFLKLTISGHMLIYVAHTKERWWRYLPSSQVIWATSLTQILATSFAFFGLFMSRVSIGWIIFIWVWAFFWMQISEIMKEVKSAISK